MWIGVGAVAAVVLPMLLAWLVTPLEVAFLAGAVWITGTVAMGYGLYRAVQRAADIDALMEEARFVALLIGGTVFLVLSLIVFLVSLVSGTGGLVGSLIELLLAGGASIVIAYGFGYFTAWIVERWHGVGQELRRLPPPREDLSDTEYASALNAVAAQWRQRVPRSI